MLKLLLLLTLFIASLPAEASRIAICRSALSQMDSGKAALAALSHRLTEKFSTKTREVALVMSLLAISNVDVSLCCENGKIEDGLSSLLERSVTESGEGSFEKFENEAIAVVEDYEKLQNEEFAKARTTPQRKIYAVNPIRESFDQILESEDYSALNADWDYRVDFAVKDPRFKGPQIFRFSKEVTKYLQDPIHKITANKLMSALKKGITSSVGHQGIKKYDGIDNAWEVKIMGTAASQRILLIHENGIWYARSILQHK